MTRIVAILVLLIAAVMLAGLALGDFAISLAEIATVLLHPRTLPRLSI